MTEGVTLLESRFNGASVQSWKGGVEHETRRVLELL